MNSLKSVVAAWLRHLTPAACLLLLTNLVLVGIPIVAMVSARAPSRPLRPRDDTFKSALEHVMQPGVQDLASDLWQLSDGAPNIVWEHQNDMDRVLVATWTSFDGYDAHAGALSDELKVDVWVTPVPQLQERCRSFGLSGAALNLRLHQYLGLGPSGAQDRVVELWVKTTDLFRPCPDDEINDRSCRLGLPAIPENPNKEQLRHARWFAERFASYGQSGALPWTRLGYTYDWGSDGSKVGASEYVIRAGSRAWVASISSTADYCRQGGPAVNRTPVPVALVASAKNETAGGSTLTSVANSAPPGQAADAPPR